MCDLHEDLSEGDAFLHNDPYLGNTHPADHGFLVPVFFEDEHMFTVCAKANQADIGNSIPRLISSMPGMSTRKDLSSSPASHSARLRNDRRYRTHVPRPEFGCPNNGMAIFWAGIGSARIGERRLKTFCEKYGKSLVKQFIREWLDYSEECMVHAIRKMPEVRLTNTGAHDRSTRFCPKGFRCRSPSISIRTRNHCCRFDRQSRLRALRAQSQRGLGHQRCSERHLQLPRIGHTAQFRIISPGDTEVS